MSRSLALTLPQELVDIIVDNLKDSKKALRRCSFLSHRYLHRVRKYSFSTINFNTWVDEGDTEDPFHVNGLSDLLLSSQKIFGDHFKLGNYIHEVAIFCERGQAHEAVVDLRQLTALLNCLPSIKRLRLTQVTLSHLVPENLGTMVGVSEMGIGIPNGAYSLERIELSMIRPRNKSVLRAFFSLFSKITVLNMHSCSYVHPSKMQYWPDVPVADLSRPQVEKLLLSTLFHTDYLEVLLESIDCQKAKDVTLRCALSYIQARPLLHSISGTVESLWVRPLSVSDDEVWCLPDCPRLGSLVIQLYFKDKNEYEVQEKLWKDAVSILQSIPQNTPTSRTPLKDLMFELGADHFRTLGPYTTAPWGTISSTLTRLAVPNTKTKLPCEEPEECKGLQKVSINFTNVGDVDTELERRKAIASGLREPLTKSGVQFVMRELLRFSI